MDVGIIRQLTTKPTIVVKTDLSAATDQEILNEFVKRFILTDKPPKINYDQIEDRLLMMLEEIGRPRSKCQTLKYTKNPGHSNPDELGLRGNW
jgi:hypothetical protein